MNAKEAKDLAEKAKAQKLNDYRTDILKRIEIAARSGNDSLILGECLKDPDIEFFQELGFFIIERSTPIFVHRNTKPDINDYYGYSEISWGMINGL